MYEPHPTFEEPENKDAKIWRYIDLPKLINLLDKNSLFFVRVSKLSDPYEGTMPEYNEKARRQMYEKDKDKFGSDTHYNQFLDSLPKYLKANYEQQKNTLAVNSWHLNEYESASMWHIYSSNHGIAIQSTFRKLCDSFKGNQEDKVMVGKVKYLDFKTEWMNEATMFDPFIVKRKSFSSESELRAITYMPNNIMNSSMDVLKPNIDTSYQTTSSGKYVFSNLDILIEKIFVSPLVEHWMYNVVESIIKKYSLNKEIEQSDLYSLK